MRLFASLDRNIELAKRRQKKWTMIQRRFQMLTGCQNTEKSHGKSNPLNTFKIPQISEESFPENNIILISFSKNC